MNQASYRAMYPVLHLAILAAIFAVVSVPQVTAAGQITIEGADQFDSNNPLFGSGNQLASNPLDERETRTDVFVDAQLTVRNSGNVSIGNISVDVVPKLGFRDSDLQITLVDAPATILPGQSLFLSLRARIPENLDAVDSSLEKVAFDVAQLKLSAVDTASVISEAEMPAFMERRNMLEIDDADVALDGKRESVDNGEDVENVLPGQAGELEVEMENNFDDDSNVAIDTIIRFNCDDNDIDIDDEQEDVGEIDSDDDEIDTFTYDIEEDAEDKNIRCSIEVEGSDDNGARHGQKIAFNFEIDRESHDVKIVTATLLPSAITCADKTTMAEVSILNLGRQDEDDVVVEVSSKDLAYVERSSPIELDEDDSDSFSFIIPIPPALKAGTYPIEVKTFFDNTKPSNSQTLPLENSCGAFEEDEEGEEEAEDEQQPTLSFFDRVTLKIGPAPKSIGSGSLISIPVEVLNKQQTPGEFEISISNVEEFAIPTSSKTIFLAPGQTGRALLNLKVRDDAQQGSQSASIVVRADGTVIASDTVSLEIGAKGLGFAAGLGASGQRAAQIVAVVIVIIIILFIINRIVVRRRR